MQGLLRAVRDYPDLRASLIKHGLETILARHTCAHRADELLGIVAALRATTPKTQAPMETA
jgi:spore maturation protein CgeB